MPQITMTINGNLTKDPELRNLPSGQSVCDFTIAHTDRRFNRQNNQWEDGQTTFINCSAWGSLGQNIQQSLGKGMAAIVIGKFEQNDYTDQQGNKRRSYRLIADFVGVDLAHATAQVMKNKGSAPQQGFQPPQQQPSLVQQRAQAYAPQPAFQPQPQEDPWAGRLN